MNLDGQRSPRFLGLDLGGTRIKAGVVDGLGRPLVSISEWTHADRGPEVGLETLVDLAKSAVESSGTNWSEIVGVGLGAAGTIDSANGWIVEAANLPLWNRFPIASRLEERLHRPTILVNDANAAAFGEYWAGAGRSTESLAMFTVGTGIGCGIVLDGRIWDGAHGLGGECGHMTIQADGGRRCSCGKRGHLEAYASANSLVRRASEALHAGDESTLSGPRAEGRLTAEAVSLHALAGDRLAQRLMGETARYLAVGASIVIHTVDPDLVLFGGGMIGAGPRFLRNIRIQARAMTLGPARDRTRIEFAELGGDAGFIGAAGWARRTVLGPEDQRGSRRGAELV
jgi:glucokinase